MSTTSAEAIESTLQRCRPAAIDPVVIDASAITSTAPEHLRDLKAELASRGYQPATLSATARFDTDETLATQEEADRLREIVRAAAFLGAGRVEVTLSEVADPSVADPALTAVTERAEREGIELVRTT